MPEHTFHLLVRRLFLVCTQMCLLRPSLCGAWFSLVDVLHASPLFPRSCRALKVETKLSWSSPLPLCGFSGGHRGHSVLSPHGPWLFCGRCTQTLKEHRACASHAASSRGLALPVPSPLPWREHCPPWGFICKVEKLGDVLLSVSSLYFHGPSGQALSSPLWALGSSFLMEFEGNWVAYCPEPDLTIKQRRRLNEKKKGFHKPLLFSE